MPWTKGKSGNPLGRPRGRSKAAEIRRAFEEDWEKAVEKIKELALAGDQKLLMYWGDKIIPTLRTVDLPGTVPSFAEAKTLSDKSGAILQSIADGELNVPDGLSLMQAVANAARISESVEQEKQIAELEAALQNAKRAA